MYRQLAAIVCSVIVGIQAAIFTDYDLPNGNKEHVLSGTQRKGRNLWNFYIRGIPIPDHESSRKDNEK
eukprot:scaffold2257_cov169-Amphora_coffeaeformis.AAC.21